MSSNGDGSMKTVDLNVGGTIYTSTMQTLTEKWPNSKLARLVLKLCPNNASESDGDQTHGGSGEIPLCFDSQNRIFIDRDGYTFRYVLDYLRRPATDEAMPPSPDCSSAGRSWLTRLVPVPTDRYRLHQEAEYYGLDALSLELRRVERPTKPARSNSRPDLIAEQQEQQPATSVEENVLKQSLKKTISLPQPLKRRDPIVDRHHRASVRGTPKTGIKGAHYITLGYRSSYDTSRDVPANDITRFRRVNRITVAGRSDVAIEVFKEDLNESRDPDRLPDGYTCRYYLKHNYLEMAFDTLAMKGFTMLNSYMLAGNNSGHGNSNSSHSYAQCEAVFFKPASSSA